MRKTTLSCSTLALLLALLLPCTSAVAARKGGTRLELQGRVDALNLISVDDPLAPGNAVGALPVSVVPLVTAGARLLDGALFIGLGFGYTSVSHSNCDEVSDGGCEEEETVTTTTSWSLSPLVSYDLISGTDAAFYFLGWFDFANLSSTSEERYRRGEPDRTTERDGDFWWGLNLGIGLRGDLSDAVALGTEWGWGILSGSTGEPDEEDSALGHGIWGTLTLQVSLPL